PTATLAEMLGLTRRTRRCCAISTASESASPRCCAGLPAANSPGGSPSRSNRRTAGRRRSTWEAPPLERYGWLRSSERSPADNALHCACIAPCFMAYHRQYLPANWRCKRRINDAVSGLARRYSAAKIFLIRVDLACESAEAFH